MDSNFGGCDFCSYPKGLVFHAYVSQRYTGHVLSISLGRLSLAHHLLSTTSLIALTVVLTHVTSRLRTVRALSLSHAHLPQLSTRQWYEGSMGGAVVVVLVVGEQQGRAVVLRVHSDPATDEHAKVAW